MRIRHGIGIGLIGGVLAASVAGLGSPALAAEPSGIDTITLPAGTVRVWVELEQSGLRPDAVSVSAKVQDRQQQVLLTATTFGVHGEVVAGAGTLQLEVLPKVGAPAASPDLAVTAIGANDRVLQSTSVRLAVPAGPKTDGTDPQPAGPDRDGAAGNGGAGGRIARTGAPELGWLAGAGLLLAIAGGSLWAVRRLGTVRDGAAR